MSWLAKLFRLADWRPSNASRMNGSIVFLASELASLASSLARLSRFACVGPVDPWAWPETFTLKKSVSLQVDVERNSLALAACSTMLLRAQPEREQHKGSDLDRAGS